MTTITVAGTITGPIQFHNNDLGFVLELMMIESGSVHQCYPGQLVDPNGYRVVVEGDLGRNVLASCTEGNTILVEGVVVTKGYLGKGGLDNDIPFERRRFYGADRSTMDIHATQVGMSMMTDIATSTPYTPGMRHPLAKTCGC